jgi:hypothetical protein
MNLNKRISIRVPKFTHTKVREAKFSPFFKVKEVPLLRSDNKEEINFRALVNEATDNIVGQVSDRYKVVTHKYASDLVKSILTKAGLEYQSLGAQTSNGGSRFYETLILPSLGFNPATGLASTAFDNFGLQKDDYFPAITIRNSYDKTCRVVFDYGMYQLKCTNGLAIPLKPTTVLSFKHTQSVNIDRVKEVLMENLEDSTKIMERVYAKLNKEEGNTYLISVLQGGFTNKFKKTLIDKLNEQDKSIHIEYDEETDPETGRVVKMDIKGITTKASAYAIYNVVTDVATHTLTNRSEREVANKKIARLFIPAGQNN